MAGLYQNPRILPKMDNAASSLNNRSMSPRIKICGVTRPEDAALAARLGADAIGMIFYPPARRCISLDRAREILRALPAFVTPVGLFVDQAIEEIRQIAGELKLRTLQLHGSESPEVVAALSDFTILKALRTDADTLPTEIGMWRAAIGAGNLAHLRGFVMETAAVKPEKQNSGVGAEHSAGGTGIANNFALLASLQSAGAFDGLPPLIVAGGLRPETVGDVVRLLNPFAVDVSSGVESEYGIKSPEKLAAFIRAAK